VVVLAGRPRLLGAAAGYASAVVFAGLPGFEGGTALAEFLAGDFSPSGRLAFSYPATPGHLTPYHHKPSEKSTARWPFGHGLSYGDYGFENLRLSSTRVAPGEAVIATVDLLPPSGQPQKRLQKEPQEQSVLWFLTDRYRSVTPSVRRLVHYQRVEASGRTTVSFTLVPERDLSFPDASGQSVLEPGVFELQVGELRAELELLEAPSSAGPSGP
jgi:beta-glucosidase